MGLRNVLWAERNKLWQGTKIQSPQQVGWVAASNLDSYQALNEKQEQDVMTEMMAKWKRPAGNFAEANVDFVDFSAENSRIGCHTSEMQMVDS